MKYIIVDGNNMGIRNAFANSELKNEDGIPTSVHYGFFNSIIKLIEQFPDREMMIAWDGKSKRRIQEAKQAVEKGLINSGYKENRISDKQEIQDFFTQLPHLKKAINQAGISQIKLNDYEADDVIASYCKKMRDENDIIVVTSDKDYFQILHDQVTLWDGMKGELTNLSSWQNKNQITPKQYIDVGALMGDNSDNIFGIPGWGEKTALKCVRQNKTWQAIINKYHTEYDYLQNNYPPITDESEFDRLKNIKTKSGKPKYPEIGIGMPFTGVALAIEDKKVKNIPKSVLMALIFEERVKLAYSLKKMDDDIPSLPPIVSPEVNCQNLIEYFNYYDIQSLQNNLNLFQINSNKAI
ncbi:MAG: 5'-3' exonuclease [bacterium]